MAQKPQYNKKITEKEVIIQEKISHQGDYYDEDIEEFINEENTIDPKGKMTIIKIVLVSIALLFAVLILLNRLDFKIFNFTKWTPFSSSSSEGFPVPMTGTSIEAGNFHTNGSECVVLSDTNLAVYDFTGYQSISEGHSYNAPMLSFSEGHYLMFDIGNKGYTVVSDEGTVKNTLKNNITTGSMSASGIYGIVTQSEEYTSELEVFNTKNELIYTYKFSSDYVTSLSISDDGSKCVISSMSSKNGAMYSNIQVLSFDNTEPVAKYTTEGNLIVKSQWVGSNVYCIGDQSTVVFNQSYDFHEYSYDGKMLTTVEIENGRAFVGVSGYEFSGASTLLIFNGTGEPDFIETEKRIDDVSSSGAQVAILSEHMVQGYDLYSFRNNEECEVGYDTKGISMLNESEIYTVGIGNIDKVKLKGKK